MNEVAERIEVLKSCIGKTDEESRKNFSESVAYLKANDSEEVQQVLSELLGNGLAEVKKEIEV